MLCVFVSGPGRLEELCAQVDADPSLRFASFTEMIYAALRAHSGTADLHDIYLWVRSLNLPL